MNWFFQDQHDEAIRRRRVLWEHLTLTKGLPTNQRDLAATLNYHSHSSLHNDLQYLRKLGYIRYPDSAALAITIVVPLVGVAHVSQ